MVADTGPGSLAGVPSAESQELHQAAGLLVARLQAEQTLLEGVAGSIALLVLEHRSVVHRDGQEVVEVVGHPSGEAADGLQALGMGDLLDQGQPLLLLLSQTDLPPLDRGFMATSTCLRAYLHCC